jgi:hypothetical protein
VRITKFHPSRVQAAKVLDLGLRQVLDPIRRLVGRVFVVIPTRVARDSPNLPYVPTRRAAQDSLVYPDRAAVLVFDPESRVVENDFLVVCIVVREKLPVQAGALVGPMLHHRYGPRIR